MTSLQTAIEDAVRGGYRDDFEPSILMSTENLIEVLTAKHTHRVLLDPAFWQCLGKQRGWVCRHCEGTGQAKNRDKCFKCGGEGWDDLWERNWHSLIDHLAQGGSVEEFFTNLTSKQ